MNNQKEINEKYLELQVLEQQLKQVSQQIINLDNQLLELQRLEENLADISKTNNNTELLVALGGGVFSKAELKSNDKVLMNVGANIVVEKEVISSKDIISRQISQVNDVLKQMEQEFQTLTWHSKLLQQDLQKLLSEMKEKKQQ